VPTRVNRLKEGEKVDAILLAGAGLSRLAINLEAFKVYRLNPRTWPGAPGQGSIAVQCRADDETTTRALEIVDHRASRSNCQWERKFLEVLEGGCATPFGCHVDGAVAWLGNLPADNSAWRSRAVQLPQGLSDKEQELFVRETLKTVFESGENVNADWLYQPL
jgi:porphobilinogen deaminase